MNQATNIFNKLIEINNVKKEINESIRKYIIDKYQIKNIRRSYKKLKNVT